MLAAEREDVGGTFRRDCSVFGTVKFFSADKGFGFIAPDVGGKDVFLHITAVKRAGISEIREGQRLTFDTEPDKRGRGLQAVNVGIAR